MNNFIQKRSYLFGCSVILLMTACGAYNQNVMFKPGGEMQEGKLQMTVNRLKSEYAVKPGDYLEVKVFTDKGERIIDPNLSINSDIGQAAANNTPKVSYLIQSDGNIDLPMTGLLHLEGLTVQEINTLLAKEYSQYYTDAFVLTKVLNRRITVLGGAKGGEVISLQNENMNLIEVIAVAGGLPENAKAHNIRLIRGDLNMPEVQLIDLSTLEGMKKANLSVQPGDIVYIEPNRRVFKETLRDITPIVSIATAVTTLIFLILTN